MSERTPLFDVCTQAGGVFGEHAGWLLPRHYGSFEREYWNTCQEAALFDVSNRGKIELIGPEARSFLHNLCTNDILHLAPGKGCEAFFATLKAKVIAHAFIYCAASPASEDALWIDVAASATDRLIKHLNRHLISERVEIKDRARDFAQVHLAGPNAGLVLGKAAGRAVDMGELEERQQVLGNVPACVLRRHALLGLPGFDICCPNEDAVTVWQTLEQCGARPAGSEAFEVLRVEAGMPADGVDFDENSLVMEVARTQQAISYTKGCYLGQEPVVRSRDLGHVNRSLLGLKIRAPSPARAGAKLFRDGNEVGNVTSSAYSPRLETAIALAYIRRGNQERGTLLDVEAGGAKVSAEVADLPLVG